MPVALIDAALQLADTISAPDELVILPPGIIQLYEMAPLLMNEEAANSIIAAFADQGVQLPIDWEHAAIMKASKGEAAPAAGWIIALSWDESRGLIASVEWTDDGKQMIVERKYKYLSPVLFVDESSRRPVVLHSAALTNKPRIKGQTELLETVTASVTLPLLTRENDLMTTKKTGSASPKWVQRVVGGKLKRIALSEESEETRVALQEDGEDGSDDASAELTEIKSMADAFKELLVAWDITLADDASVVDIMNAVGELLMRLYDEVTQSDDAAPVEDIAAEVSDVAASISDDAAKNAALSQPVFQAKVCEKLGLARGTPVEKILASVVAMKGHVGFVPVGRFNELSKRLGKIEAEKNAEKTEELVAQYVTQQKLNVYDDDQMKWARDCAKTDPKGFKLVMAGATTIVPTERHVTTTSDDTVGSASTERGRLIASASQDYRNNPKVSGMCALSAWVDGELTEAGQHMLTLAEKKELA